MDQLILPVSTGMETTSKRKDIKFYSLLFFFVFLLLFVGARGGDIQLVAAQAAGMGRQVFVGGGERGWW